MSASVDSVIKSDISTVLNGFFWFLFCYFLSLGSSLRALMIKAEAEGVEIRKDRHSCCLSHTHRDRDCVFTGTYSDGRRFEKMAGSYPNGPSYVFFPSQPFYNKVW